MVAVNYLWNPINDNIVREFDESGNTIAEYTTEPDLYGNVVSQHRNGQTSYQHSDGQGSTTELTNDVGNVTDTIRYSAFGEVTERTGSTEIRFQYTGQWGYYRNEETGDYSVRARALSPRDGRWLAIDPWAATNFVGVSLFMYVGDLHSSLSAEPYSYSANNPICKYDPSGLLSQKYHGEGYNGIPCGGYTWSTSWVLDASERNGYIIQRVVIKEKLQKCDKTAIDPGLPCVTKKRQGPKYASTAVYFEIWYVDRNGNIFADAKGTPPQKKLGQDEIHDTFSREESNDRIGCHNKYGEAIFVPKKDFRWPKDDSDARLPQAGQLTAICSSEYITLFPKLLITYKKSLTAKIVIRRWVCCDCQYGLTFVDDEDHRISGSESGLSPSEVEAIELDPKTDCK